MSNLHSLSVFAQEQMNTWRIPGISIGLLQGDRGDFIPLGSAREDTKCAVSSETLFPAGSVSKAFTATLVMVLVDEGLLELDVPVTEYIPDLRFSDREAENSITLRHLLTHTSGIFGDYFDDHGQGDDALDRALERFVDLPLLHSPGELWAYSNSSFCLAGAVVARVLGTTYEAAMTEKVLKPLSMERTVLFPHDAIAYPVAVGHTPGQAGAMQVNRKFLVTRYMSPAAGLITTAEDMIRFARSHLGKGPQILKPETRVEMHREQVTAAHRADNWGLGWGIKDLGTKVLEHTGSVNATAAQVTFVPENSFAVCVLANGAAGLGATRSICNRALELFCGLDTSPPSRVDLAPQELELLEGLYRQPSGDVRVSRDNGDLMVEPEGGASFSAYPIDPSRFIITQGAAAGLRVEFVLQEGRARFVNINGRLLARVE